MSSEDDAAINGCRPEFASVGGRPLLATADYGDIRPEIRLYDPAALLAAGRSSAPGVVIHRVLCGPFNQNLHWDAGAGQLFCVQNVIAGRGWRLDVLDLARAVADGRAEGPMARVRRPTFPSHEEPGGIYWPLTTGPRPSSPVARRFDDNLYAVLPFVRLTRARRLLVRRCPAAKPRPRVVDRAGRLTYRKSFTRPRSSSSPSSSPLRHAWASRPGRAGHFARTLKRLYQVMRFIQ